MSQRRCGAVCHFGPRCATLNFACLDTIDEGPRPGMKKALASGERRVWRPRPIRPLSIPASTLWRSQASRSVYAPISRSIA